MISGAPVLRLITQPNDANPKGDIFGGWLMSQIDIAGAITAAAASRGSIATVAVKDLQFICPLFVHDIVSFYTHVVKIGNTSITVAAEVYAQRGFNKLAEPIKISEATLIYVAIDEPGNKRKIERALRHCEPER